MLAHRLRVHLVQGLEDELHERAVAAAGGGLGAKRARVGVEVRVPPQPFGELLRVHLHPSALGVEPREALQREGPAVERGPEAHRALGRVSERAVLAAAVRGFDDRVDLLQDVPDLVERIRGRELELEDEPVHLVHEHHDREPVARGVLDDALRDAHHTLHRVHHQQHGVRQPQRRRDLVREVDVPRRVHEVEQQVLPAQRRHRHRQRRRLDGNLAVLLILPVVHVTHLPLGVAPLRGHQVRLLHHHVHEGRLAVVQVAADGDVAGKVGVAQHPEHVLLADAHHRRVRVAHFHALCLQRRDDGLLQRLRVLVHDQRLGAFAVHLLGGWVVLLVLGEHDGRLRVVLLLLDIHRASALGVARVRLALSLVHPRVVLSSRARKSEGREGQVATKEKKSRRLRKEAKRSALSARS